MPGLSFPMLFGLCGRQPTRLSQAMHNAAFRARGHSAFYVAFDTGDTAAALTSMRNLGIWGLSLTIPHKEQAVDLVDVPSSEVLSIRAVNTVLNDGRQLFGHNTDYLGIIAAFSEARIDVARHTVVVMGAGGAARSAVYAFLGMGVSNSRVIVASRSDERAAKLANDFGIACGRYDELPERMRDPIVIVNTTPVGSHIRDIDDAYPFPLELITSDHVVFDAVTNDTPLLVAARRAGAVTISGIRMLLHQAAKQYELFTGEATAPLGEMEAALHGEYNLKTV